MVQKSIKHFPIPLRKSFSRCLILVPLRDPAFNLNRLAGKVMALAIGSQTIVPQLIAESDFLGV